MKPRPQKIMEVLQSISEIRQAIGRRSGGRVVLVPTMGALHEGHRSLMEEGRDLAGEDGVLVVSVFVNPMQFGASEDFEDYPRTLDADSRICEESGVDLIFAPLAKEMYAPNHSVKVIEECVSTHLCGASRPGHFSGVCTVVAKLFNIISPDIAVFGEKDVQQLAVIRRMVRDLNFPVDVVGVETVREDSGLALSSRNKYLDAEMRKDAAVLRQALIAAEQKFFRGERSVGALVDIATNLISSVDEARIDYVEIVDSDTFQPVKEIQRDAVMALAVFFGGTRLIDNIDLKLEDCLGSLD